MDQDEGGVVGNCLLAGYTCPVNIVEVEQDDKWYGSDAGTYRVLMLVLCELASNSKVEVSQIMQVGVFVSHHRNYIDD